MIYNYRSDETVQDVILECFCPLIEDISDEYSTLRRYENLSIYAPSYIAREILCRILNAIDDVWIHEESRSELLYKDDNEVIITIASDGMIFVENARGENSQLKCNYDCALTYVYDGFTKEDVNALSDNEDSILIFGFEEDDFEDDKDEDEESETEHTYTVNGKQVDKETFDKYVSKFSPDSVDNEEKDKTSDDDSYSISVKCNLDADETLGIIADMERRMMHMDDMFREMDCFRWLFNW